MPKEVHLEDDPRYSRRAIRSKHQSSLAESPGAGDSENVSPNIGHFRRQDYEELSQAIQALESRKSGLSRESDDIIRLDDVLPPVFQQATIDALAQFKSASVQEGRSILDGSDDSLDFDEAPLAGRPRSPSPLVPRPRIFDLSDEEPYLQQLGFDVLG